MRQRLASSALTQGRGHGAVFSKLGGLTPEQVRATVTGSANDACWSAEDQVLLRLCDSLHEHSDIDDGLWNELRTYFAEEAIIELLMLAGFYRTVSYLTNGLRMPLEEVGARFPAEAASGSSASALTTVQQQEIAR